MCNEKLQYTSLRYPLEFTCICGCVRERETTRDRRAWKNDQENSNDPIFVRSLKKPAQVTTDWRICSNHYFCPSDFNTFKPLSTSEGPFTGFVWDGANKVKTGRSEERR